VEIVFRREGLGEIRRVILLPDSVEVPSAQTP